MQKTTALAVEIVEARPDHLPFERLRAGPEMPIKSIHAPAPRMRHDGDRANTALHLALLDDTARCGRLLREL